MGKYLLQSYLDHHCAVDPDKPALIDEQGPVSYGALCDDANRMAARLKEGGVQRQDRVAIWLKRSAQVVMVMMGVLKADAIYVPVDAKAPLERLLKVVEDCGPAAIVCEERDLPLLDAAKDRLPGVRVLLVFGATGPVASPAGILRLSWADSPAAGQPRYRNIDTDPAYILYTSGSTGSPKGVTVSHLNVTSYIDWAVDCFQIGPTDRVLGTAPFHFDMSTFDVYATLKAGATLCIPPEKSLLFPRALLDLMEREGITIWKGVSSLLAYLSGTGALKEGRLPCLDRVLFGGEVLPTKHLINWMTVFPGKRFYNVYGPTETTGISAYYPVERVPATAGEPIPIGRACANTEILVLTEGDALAGPSETGELCIRGSGVSLGYWNDEEHSARVFVPNPLGSSRQDRIYRTGDLAKVREDGVIEYLGRKDFQIKFMGYRIETFEVERALLSEEGVQQAAVLLCGTPQEELSELVAFVEGDQEADRESLLARLGRTLPCYMVPRQIISLRRLPVTDRGKIDRGALREHYRQLVQKRQWGGA